MPVNPYERIKSTQISKSLSALEQQEMETLSGIKRRTANQQARLEDLWAKAFELHTPPQPDPLIAYAEEIGRRMREH